MLKSFVLTVSAYLYAPFVLAGPAILHARGGHIVKGHEIYVCASGSYHGHDAIAAASMAKELTENILRKNGAEWNEPLQLSDFHLSLIHQENYFFPVKTGIRTATFPSSTGPFYAYPVVAGGVYPHQSANTDRIIMDIQFNVISLMYMQSGAYYPCELGYPNYSTDED
ncbi:hypothetical protein K3495_g12745 [Podosphaera aphanis]|nr:hypothetical protein K3495_g12745 [Podosphaera aphanis]